MKELDNIKVSKRGLQNSNVIRNLMELPTMIFSPKDACERYCGNSFVNDVTFFHFIHSPHVMTTNEQIFFVVKPFYTKTVRLQMIPLCLPSSKMTGITLLLNIYLDGGKKGVSFEGVANILAQFYICVHYSLFFLHFILQIISLN